MAALQKTHAQTHKQTQNIHVQTSTSTHMYARTCKYTHKNMHTHRHNQRFKSLSLGPFCVCQCGINDYFTGLDYLARSLSVFTEKNN